MTDITDRHTLRRMSWSELFTAAQEAEFQRDYERARIVWSFALHVAFWCKCCSNYSTGAG